MRKRILRWLVIGVETQLFLSLCSLPILLAWGIPISLASLVGNLLFTPFLTVFLCLSSLLFFAQLLHLPCAAFAWALEKVTHTWLWLLGFGSAEWLCELWCPPVWALLAIIGCAVGILVSRMHTYHRIFAFAVLFAGTCLLLHFWQREKNQFFVTTSGWHSVTIMHTDTKTALIDRGGLQHAGRSWARYTLKPELIKRLGRSKIDYCVIAHPRPKTLQAAATLCKVCKVSKLYVPAWSGKASATFWQALGSLRFSCGKNGTELLPVGTDEIQLPWDEAHQLHIIPEKPLVEIEDMQIPRIRVTS